MTKTIPISIKIKSISIKSYTMKRGIPICEWWKVKGDWDNNNFRFPDGGGEDQQNNYYDQEIEINKKEQHCENHS